MVVWVSALLLVECNVNLKLDDHVISSKVAMLHSALIRSKESYKLVAQQSVLPFGVRAFECTKVFWKIGSNG